MRSGDCLTCSKIATCTETSVERALTSYVCPLFEPVPEPVYAARITMMQQYGEATAVEAMLNRPQEPVEEGEVDV